MMAYAQVWRSFALKIYGNWCGPGHSGEVGVTLDLLDEQCQEHDLCYVQNGWGNVECDVELVLDIRAYRARKGWRTAPRRFRARVASWAIQSAFSLRPAVRKVLKAKDDHDPRRLYPPPNR